MTTASGRRWRPALRLRWLLAAVALAAAGLGAERAWRLGYLPRQDEQGRLALWHRRKARLLGYDVQDMEYFVTRSPSMTVRQRAGRPILRAIEEDRAAMRRHLDHAWWHDLWAGPRHDSRSRTFDLHFGPRRNRNLRPPAASAPAPPASGAPDP